MGRKNITVISVPIRVNKKQRESRLVKSIFSYLARSFITITRIFVMYRPLRFFATLGVILFAASSVLFIRFAYFFFLGLGNLYIKSLITGGVLITLSLILFVVGLLSDIISSNRTLIEEMLYRVRKIEYKTVQKKEK